MGQSARVFAIVHAHCFLSMSTSDSSTPAKRPASVLDPSTQPSDDAGDRPLPASPAPHANYPVAAPIDAGEDVCPRCFRIHPGGLVECMIPGSWPKAFPALYGGDCACGATWGCQRIIGSKELLGGDAEQASMVLKVPDVGVMHVDCAIKMLEDISGPVESYADSRARLLQMMYDKHVMPGIQHGVLDLFDLEKPPDDGGDRFGATITNSVPGAVKSGEQAILHRHHGPLLTLGLVFNSAAAKGLRKGGALNSHTYNSYGGSQLVRHNNDNLYHWRYLSSQKSLHAPFTAAEVCALAFLFLCALRPSFPPPPCPRRLTLLHAFCRTPTPPVCRCSKTATSTTPC